MNLLFGVALGLYFASLVGTEPSTLKRLDGSASFLAHAEMIARDVLQANGVTGAQIAVIDHGRVAWKRAFGYRRLDPPLPMETTTNIWAASITKGVFAAYVLTRRNFVGCAGGAAVGPAALLHVMLVQPHL